jgi:hypothetical protein
MFNIWAYRSAKEQQSKSSASVYLYQLSSDVKGPSFFPTDINIPGDVPCLCWPHFLLLKSTDLRENKQESIKKYPVNHMPYAEKTL